MSFFLGDIVSLVAPNLLLVTGLVNDVCALSVWMRLNSPRERSDGGIIGVLEWRLCLFLSVFNVMLHGSFPVKEGKQNEPTARWYGLWAHVINGRGMERLLQAAFLISRKEYELLF